MEIDIAAFQAECADYLGSWGVSAVIEIVIHGASLIDTAIGHRIRAEIIGGSTANALLRPTGLLGDYSGKLQVLYCFKFINKDTFQDCQSISELRNIFAHQRSVRNLDGSDQRAKVRSLNILSAISSKASGLSALIIDELLPIQQFALASCLLAMDIASAAAESAFDASVNCEILRRLGSTA